MKHIETELCAYSLYACQVAARCGVTRVELCASPAEGGTTPSAGIIRLARRVEGIRLHVMIRPRGGDFLYNDCEFEQMRHEIRFARECGADGVVLGILTPDGRVDVGRCSVLVAEAGGMNVTFHRAFDMTRDMDEALEDVIAAGCSRILTSGGCNTAPEGIDTLQRLAERAAGRTLIMAGSGVQPGNAGALIAAGVDALHFSARRRLNCGGMRFRKEGISMGGNGAVSEYEMMDADPDFVWNMVAQCRRM